MEEFDKDILSEEKQESVKERKEENKENKVKKEKQKKTKSKEKKKTRKKETDKTNKEKNRKKKTSNKAKRGKSNNKRRINKNKLMAVLGIIIAVLIIFGIVKLCTKDKMFKKGKLIVKDGEYLATYEEFNGEKTYDLNDCNQVTLDYEINTISGNLSIEVVDSEGRTILAVKDYGQGIKNEMCLGKKNLKLKIKGDRHKGDFKFKIKQD